MSDFPFTASQRLNLVQQPIIPQVAALIHSNPGTISLGQGVVNYPPPPTSIRQATQFDNALDKHHYSDVVGISALRQSIMEKLQRENEMDLVEIDRIIVTAGSNMGFMNAILAISNPGDEIILLRPYYFNHDMAISMLGCKTIAVDCDEDYQPDINKLASAINTKTRAIVTISPNNPSGAVYSEAVLREINSLCQKYGIFHISDEAYEYFTYDDAEHFSPGSISGSEEHTISLFSLSKAYGFASWRIGYMLIPVQLADAVKKIQDTNLICPTRIAQEAAISALQEGKSYTLDHLPQIKHTREALYRALSSITSICKTPRTGGAFYFLIKLNTELSSLKVVEHLINRHKVAIIPGDTFGVSDGCYARVAYGALDKDTASIAIDRLISGLMDIIQ